MRSSARSLLTTLNAFTRFRVRDYADYCEERFHKHLIAIPRNEPFVVRRDGMVYKGKLKDFFARAAGSLIPWAVNLWITLVVIWFFVVRILGSATFRHFLPPMGSK